MCEALPLSVTVTPLLPATHANVLKCANDSDDWFVHAIKLVTKLAGVPVHSLLL